MSRTFRYSGIDSNGRRARGSILAASRDEAIALLRRQRLTVTSLDENSEPVVNKETTLIQSIFDLFGFTFVSQKAMAEYTRKLASMINAGITYGETFDILSEETENRRLGKISRKISKDIARGENVHTALSKHPDVFTKVYRSMINTGEATGRLHHILNQLADMYEEEHELRSQVLSKIYFPIFYLIAGLVLIGAVIFFVPMFFGPQAVPFSVSLYRAILTLYFFLVVLILLGRTKPGYKIFRSIIAQIPPFGGLLRKMSLARFSRLFAAMYGSGVPVMTGLDIAGETLMEPDLIRGLKTVKSQVHQGEDLTTALTRSRIFPKSLRGMVRTGEVSGNVEEMLNKAADYYEIDIKTKSSMVASIFTILVLVVVLLTLAIFVISAWGGYFKTIDGLIEGNW